MIDYDSFSRCHLANIFFAFHAGAKELTQSDNYSFVASFDKISSNNKKNLSKFSNYLRVSKHPQNICMVSKKSEFGL